MGNKRMENKMFAEKMKISHVEILNVTLCVIKLDVAHFNLVIGICNWLDIPRALPHLLFIGGTGRCINKMNERKGKNYKIIMRVKGRKPHK